MRVYPPVSKEELVVYLSAQAKLMWGDASPVSESVLDTLAEAMAMVGAIDVPDDIEPQFP